MDVGRFLSDGVTSMLVTNVGHEIRAPQDVDVLAVLDL